MNKEQKKAEREAFEQQGQQSVAQISGIDEYGPILKWERHWADVGVGARLYTHPAPTSQPVYDKSVVARIATQMGWTPPASQPVGEAVAANECAQDVYQHGQSIGLFDIPKDTANAICAGITAMTGARVDWHYIGGRVHMKAIAAPSVAQAGLSEAARTLVDELQGRHLDLMPDSVQRAHDNVRAILARSGQPAQEGK